MCQRGSPGGTEEHAWGSDPPGGGLTLTVHAEGIKQAGPAELSTQQGHIQLHQPCRLAVLSWQLQLTAAHPTARQPPGVPTAPCCFGEEAVHKVQLGFLDAIDEGVLWGQESSDTGWCCWGLTPVCHGGHPEQGDRMHKAWWWDPPARCPLLTTCSLTWMHSDFFLTAATPVVKVFLMLVARRRASCEPPSSPATEPDSTSAELPRPANRLLMIFLGVQRDRHPQNRLLPNHPVLHSPKLGTLLTSVTPAAAWRRSGWPDYA